MEHFFNPKSVAVIGASSTKGKIGYEIVANIAGSGIPVFPVNPHRDTILGKRCYKSVEEIPEEVNLAVLAIDAEKCASAVEQCGRKGIRRVVIISGGFRETGNEELEQELVATARKYGIRIIGPNCIGVFNGTTGFNTFFQRHMELPPPGTVSIMTQSGTFGIALLEKFAREHIGVNHFASYGNRADVNEVDLLAHFEDDPATRIIAVYVEDMGRDFFSRKFTKPVVVLKAGRSRLGQKAASLHTGAMATDYAIFKGACRQKRVIFADDFQEFFGIIKILALRGTPPGRSIAIITNGAGPGVLACDFLDSAQHLEVSGDMVDLTGSATADDYLRAIDESTADIIILTFVFQDAPLAETLETLYEGLRTRNRFFVALAMGGTFPEEQMSTLASMGIPAFEEPGVAIRALNAIAMHLLRP